MIAVIDLHTAPGSQNGFDNSGREGEPNWVNWGQVSTALAFYFFVNFNHQIFLEFFCFNSLQTHVEQFTVDNSFLFHINIM